MAVSTMDTPIELPIQADAPKPLTHSRQVIRKELFDRIFTRYYDARGHAVPKDLLPRQLARAYAAGEWKGMRG
jgi:hypothetical protein